MWDRAECTPICMYTRNSQSDSQFLSLSLSLMDVEKPSSSPSKWRKIINNLRENKNFQEFCCLAVFVGSIGIIVLVIILTAKASSADDQLNFEVKNISFTSFNIRSSKINFHSGVQFSIRNPLKSNIFYSNFASSLSYKDEIIAQNVTSPFIQPKKSQMQVNATFVARDVSFSDKRFMDFLLVDMDFGEVTFKITIYVGPTVAMGWWIWFARIWTWCFGTTAKWGSCPVVQISVMVEKCYYETLASLRKLVRSEGENQSIRGWDQDHDPKGTAFSRGY